MTLFEFTGRFVSILFGSLLVYPVFMIARLAYKTIVGLLAAALIAFSMVIKKGSNSHNYNFNNWSLLL